MVYIHEEGCWSLVRAPDFEVVDPRSVLELDFNSQLHLNQVQTRHLFIVFVAGNHME